MCRPDDRLFSGAQRRYAILEPSACDAFRTCVVFMGVPVYTHPVDYLELFPGNGNRHHLSDDVSCHELQLVCHREVGRCEVEGEDEDAASGFPVALCNTAIQSCDRHSNQSFLLLRISDFVVDAVDAVDVSVPEFVLVPPSEHLAFSGITYTPGFIVSSPIFLLHRMFLSFLIRQRMELTLEMSYCPTFCTFLPKCCRC